MAKTAPEGLIAVLDIGSSKVACLIARRADSTEGEPRIAGAGAQGTKGVRSGAVVDLDNLERSIRLAVEQAERAADVRITDVVLGVSGPDLRSDVVRAVLPLDIDRAAIGRPVDAGDIDVEIEAEVDLDAARAIGVYHEQLDHGIVGARRGVALVEQCLAEPADAELPRGVAAGTAVGGDGGAG